MFLILGGYSVFCVFQVLTTIQMEWWMLSPLDAGGALQIHSPGSGLAFDLSVTCTM